MQATLLAVNQLFCNGQISNKQILAFLIDSKGSLEVQETSKVTITII